ncbi:hypothetical protein V6N11_069366 [Hibiscus sabdariffa]|uniref:Uncharacterized protein n=2 Tax=Hibiscus sabdariffa TaxID=183260 RepID=A0ABR1Z8W0_9ROSI
MGKVPLVDAPSSDNEGRSLGEEDLLGNNQSNVLSSQKQLGKVTPEQGSYVQDRSANLLEAHVDILNNPGPVKIPSAGQPSEEKKYKPLAL